MQFKAAYYQGIGRVVLTSDVLVRLTSLFFLKDPESPGADLVTGSDALHYRSVMVLWTSY